MFAAEVHAMLVFFDPCYKEYQHVNREL